MTQETGLFLVFMWVQGMILGVGLTILLAWARFERRTVKIASITLFLVVMGLSSAAVATDPEGVAAFSRRYLLGSEPSCIRVDGVLYCQP